MVKPDAVAMTSPFEATVYSVAAVVASGPPAVIVVPAME